MMVFYKLNTIELMITSFWSIVICPVIYTIISTRIPPNDTKTNKRTKK